MDRQQHLYDLVKDFGTAMMVTRSSDGHAHARPMAVGELLPDTQAYFVTGIETPKIAEIENDAETLITFQGKTEFATLAGTISVERDRTIIDRLWKESWRAWFPQGKEDPSLCVLRFEPREGEYWDDSGMQGLKYLFRGAKAVLQGERPAVDADQHAKVKL